jgi:ABC-type transport system involved in multi-copper enzyme maturation permease subunit
MQKNRSITAIAVNTFRESFRDRILLGALVISVFFILFSLFVGSISLDQDTKIIQDTGLTVIFLLQIFVAIFVGASLIFKEVERKTFFILIPKPLKRSEIIIGKWIGLLMTTMAVSGLTAVVYFGILFIRGASLALAWGLLLAIVLGLVETAVVILISILFSSLTSPILASLYTTSLFFIGHSSDVIYSVIEQHKESFWRFVYYFFYYLFPNLEKFNIRNDVIYQILPSAKDVILILLYAAAYSVFVYALAVMVFKRREY